MIKIFIVLVGAFLGIMFLVSIIGVVTILVIHIQESRTLEGRKILHDVARKMRREL